MWGMLHRGRRSATHPTATAVMAAADFDIIDFSREDGDDLAEEEDEEEEEEEIREVTDAPIGWDDDEGDEDEEEEEDLLDDDDPDAEGSDKDAEARNPLDDDEDEEDATDEEDLHYVDLEHWEDRWILCSDPFKTFDDPDLPPLSEKALEEYEDIMEDHRWEEDPDPLPALSPYTHMQSRLEPTLEEQAEARKYDGALFDGDIEMYDTDPDVDGGPVDSGVTQLDLCIQVDPEGWREFVRDAYVELGCFTALLPAELQAGLRANFSDPDQRAEGDRVAEAARIIREALRDTDFTTLALPDVDKASLVKWALYRTKVTGIKTPEAEAGWVITTVQKDGDEATPTPVGAP